MNRRARCLADGAAPGAAARVLAAVGGMVVLCLVVSCSALVSKPPLARNVQATARSSGRSATGTSPRAGTSPQTGTSPLSLAARTHMPSAAVRVLARTAPGELTARFARMLFASSPVVVVARAGGAGPSASVPAVARRAARATHAPLLLADGITAGDIAKLAGAVGGLRPRAVLPVGLPRTAVRTLAARLPGVHVVTRRAALPATRGPAPLSGLAVLVPNSAGGVLTAVTTTAKAAGAAVIPLTGPDPRTDPAAIRELARRKPLRVIAVGARFGPVARLASRLAVAETGRQLPGGGQVLFPGRRLVALYGHPGTPGLGVLGQQDLAASIARARRMAAAYRPLSSVPVVPAFEIIATVAEGSPGPDGTYSYQTPVSDLLPWVHAATAAGFYVVLDLQAGRASLLAQAKLYRSLLKLPDVGLALDPEWKLQPGQKPLRQIGHVDIAAVNDVIDWLAALTARYHLPQKLLVLHQFRLSMIVGEQDLNTSHDDLSIIIHMDGQGTPAEKQTTWNAVTAAAPPGVHFGWKNFLVMDHPMLTPQQTMTKTPAPVMISYQ